MSKIKVLIVDDEKDLLEVGSEIVKGWGYEVITASSGQDAIDIIKNHGTDIMVIDYLMPEMDGVATLINIREFNKDIPVIMFTAFPDERSIEGTQKLKVSVFIPKLSDRIDPWKALRSALNIAQRNLPK